MNATKKIDNTILFGLELAGNVNANPCATYRSSRNFGHRWCILARI